MIKQRFFVQRLFFYSLISLILFSFKVWPLTQQSFSAPAANQAAQVELFKFNSPQQQKTAIELARSLRCPQCQNQNLVESNSPIARDLRLIVFQKINQGETEQEVVNFMTARYGEFVLYKPAFNPATALLWLAPALVLLLFIFFSVRRIRA